MKKAVLSLVLLTALFASSAFAADPGFVKKGDIAVLAGIGYNGYMGFYAGGEYGIMPIAASPQFTIDLTGRLLGTYWGKTTSGSLLYSYKYSYSYIGVGGYAVGHVAWKQFKLKNEFLDNLDSWIGLGIGATFLNTDYTYNSTTTTTSSTDFGLAYCGGTAYWFSKELAVSYDYNGQVGSAIGVIYKF